MPIARSAFLFRFFLVNSVELFICADFSKINRIIKISVLCKYNAIHAKLLKHGDLDYSVDFAEIGTYEQFYGIDEEETE